MPINIDSASEGGFKILGDGGEDAAGVAVIKTAHATTPALSVGRSINGSATVAAVQFLGTSVASGAILGFGGGFISLTSVVLTTVANTDYAIPVQVGLQMRYIPLFKAAALIGGATF
jgi:dolichol kinase